MRRYANVAGRALDKWSFEDRITLLGDAAHTHGGAFAAGAALAIDDAYALSLALDHVFPSGSEVGVGPIDPSHIALALDLYETTRRPHSARVLAIVHENRRKALIRQKNRANGQPESDEEFRSRFANRTDPVWLTEHDVEQAFENVLSEKLSKDVLEVQGDTLKDKALPTVQVQPIPNLY